MSSCCPTSYDFPIYCGTLFTKVFTFKNPDGTLQDLTGLGFVLAAKTNIDNPEVDLEMSTNNGRAVNGGAAGTISLTLLPANSEDIDVSQMDYVAYFINLSNQPLPPSFQGTITFSQATLPSGG